PPPHRNPARRGGSHHQSAAAGRVGTFAKERLHGHRLGDPRRRAHAAGEEEAMTLSIARRTSPWPSGHASRAFNTNRTGPRARPITTTGGRSTSWCVASSGSDPPGFGGPQS